MKIKQNKKVTRSKTITSKSKKCTKKLVGVPCKFCGTMFAHLEHTVLSKKNHTHLTSTGNQSTLSREKIKRLE